ncbi:hypothetical protein ACFL6L_02890 [candidate division KSB1 bacterium]
MNTNFFRPYVLVIFLLCCIPVRFYAQENPQVRVETLTPVKRIINFNNGDALKTEPLDIRYNAIDKKVYVADSRNNRVVVFDEFLQFIGIFGSSGSDPGEFGRPSGIAFTSDGDIIVAGHNKRLQIFNKNYEFVSFFKVPQSAYDAEFSPVVDGEDNILFNYPDRNFPDAGTLFSVFNIAGDIIKTGGELMEIDESRYDAVIWRTCENLVFIETDISSGLIYAAFINKPLIRIYNTEFQVVKEIDISEYDEIKKITKAWKKTKRSSGYQQKRYIRSVSIDAQYFYAYLGYKLYAFSKENLDVEKEIDLLTGNPKLDKPENRDMWTIDFRHENRVFAIYRDHGEIFMYNK